MMRSSSQRTRWAAGMRIAAIAVIVVVVSFLALNIASLLAVVDASVERERAKDLEQVERAINASLEEAATVATLIAAQPEVASALVRGDRDGLLERTLGVFEDLRREHRVAQLHFSIPPATAFLRVHAPDHHGDELLTSRRLVVEVTSTGRTVSSIERDQWGLAARAVAPVFAPAPEAGETSTPRSVRRVVGTVDVGIALDEGFLTRALPGAAVALIPLEPATVASAPGRAGGGFELAVTSGLPEDIVLQVDSAEDAQRLVDADLATVDHDPAHWTLSRAVLSDHDREPAAIVLVATDVRQARADVRAAWRSFALAAVLMLFGGAALAVLKRRNDAELADIRRSVDLGGRLGRALRFADNETETLAVVAEALPEAAANQPARLLLADSSRAHMTVAVDLGYDTDPDGLPTPQRCPATRSGELQRFTDPSALDACPFVKRGVCSAGTSGAVRCQPLSIQGATIGVLQVQANHGRLERHVEHQLDDLVRQTGDHISVVRAFAETSHQARTDPLTGLSNRRSFETEVAHALETGNPYAVAFLDLDRFKDLNDRHGHEVGDRALRVFAGVLKGSVRPRDLVARYGGEEFVVFFSDCNRDQARDAAERIRSQLLVTLATGTVPGFTVSIGIADHRSSSDPFHGEGFDAVVAAADAALLEAKLNGRDRVVLHEAEAQPLAT